LTSDKSKVAVHLGLLPQLHMSDDPESLIGGLLNSPAIGIAICDRRLRFQLVNQALASMNGIPLQAHLGKTITQVLGKPAGELCPAFERVFETGQSISNFELTAKLPTKANVGRWVENFFPLTDRHGKVIRVGVVVVEITNVMQPLLDTFGLSGPFLPQVGFVPGSVKPQNFVFQISDSQLFRHLDKGTIDRIMRVARRYTRAHKEIFCRQGERSTNLTLLVKGLVKVGATTDAGKEVLLDWMQPGEVFGLGALVSPPAENFWTICSDGQTEVLEWDGASIARLAESCPKFHSNALSIALRWTRHLQERFEELSTKLVEPRLARLVVSLAGRLGARGRAIVNISDEELAQMAGTNLFTVNKLIHVWQRLGYVNKSRRRLVILDLPSLVNVSCSATMTD
jgi:CRP-like cAMP-binding protein